MVPLIDLSRRLRAIEPALLDAVARIVESGVILLGPELERFEDEFAAYCRAKHAVGVGSGTDALELTISALGIGAGDEVIVPAFTAVPTAAAVCTAGATPVFADVDPRTATVTKDSVATVITDRTALVIPVHLYGRPAPVDEIARLGIPVVEDAAQAHGAVDGSNSIAATYSFYPTKNLGGIGDGGSVVTDSAEFAADLRMRRHHGMSKQYVHQMIATNSRMSELEAAALSIGLVDLDANNARRREIAAHYRSAAPNLAWQEPHPDHVYHLCVLRTTDRDEFRARLGVATAVHYPLALTEQPAYDAYRRTGCPEAESWARECVTLPCFPEMTDDEVDVVCRALH